MRRIEQFARRDSGGVADCQRSRCECRTAARAQIAPPLYTGTLGQHCLTHACRRPYRRATHQPATFQTRAGARFTSKITGRIQWDRACGRYRILRPDARYRRMGFHARQEWRLFPRAHPHLHGRGRHSYRYQRCIVRACLAQASARFAPQITMLQCLGAVEPWKPVTHQGSRVFVFHRRAILFVQCHLFAMRRGYGAVPPQKNNPHDVVDVQARPRTARHRRCL